MLSREDIIKYITKCVDCAMPILQDENGLDVSRGYSFMLDKDKKAKVHMGSEMCIRDSDYSIKAPFGVLFLCNKMR